MNKENIKLSNGFSVPENIYEGFRQMVVAFLPEISPGKAYTLRKILGRDIWSELDNGERRLMGRCVAHMSVHNILPLCLVGTTKANSQLYKLK